MLVLWALWVFQSFLSANQVRTYLQLCRRRLKRVKAEPFTPHAVIILPCKGIDRDLAAGVAALCDQDYPEYELVAVVESDQDPAYAVLLSEMAKHPQRQGRVIVAGLAPTNQGQKIHNQLAAIDELTERGQGGENDDTVWVFADSDIVPGRGWLRALVAPLRAEHKTGLTTGYRWLIPSAGVGRGRVWWSSLASVMNGSVACLMGRDWLNHAWGGSMALLARTARRGGLRGLLQGALCDDFQFTRLCRSLGLTVYLVPGCVVTTPVAFEWRDLADFARRQYVLTRVYAPKLFIPAVCLTSVYVAGFYSAVAWLAVELFRPPQGGGWMWPAGVLVAGFILNQARASYRRGVVGCLFGDRVDDQLRLAFVLDRWATPLWMTLHWLLVTWSAFGRTLGWRSNRYRLYSPQRVEKLG